jgi:hypothetical protein
VEDVLDGAGVRSAAGMVEELPVDVGEPPRPAPATGESACGAE